MFFQDQCNLPDEVNNHTRLQSNHVGKAFECAIRKKMALLKQFMETQILQLVGSAVYLRMRECVNIFSDWK